MEIWRKIDEAKINKSRVLVGTTAGIEIEGILIDVDSNGSMEIQTGEKGTVYLFGDKIEYFSVLDNLTHIERIAKQKGLVW